MQSKPYRLVTGELETSRSLLPGGNKVMVQIDQNSDKVYICNEFLEDISILQKDFPEFLRMLETAWRNYCQDVGADFKVIR